MDGVGGGASFHYDLAGNRLRVETKGGASQDFEYDAAGNIIGIVDGNHNRTDYRLDKWGRITQVLKADGSIEFYTYDYAGNMTSSTDGEGHTTQYEYNRAGLMSKLIDPMGEAEAYAYDGMGRMVRKADRNGNITEYGYTFYDAPLYRRNQATGLEEVYAYTPEGLLRAAIGGGMRYSYEYDEMGRLLRKSASGRALLSHTYDKNGNRISQTDVTGRTIEYMYNDLDLLVEVYENGSKLSTYEHNPDGTVKSLQNGPLRTLYSYDLDKNITGLVASSYGQLLVENYYSYDGNGNRLSKQQLGGDTKYTFDALNQLIKVQYPSLTEELFYDKSGNRMRREVDGVEELYHYDPRNRLTQLSRGGVVTTFRYDNAGNLLADDKALYSYDAFNRTTKVETIDGNVQVNRYDAEGLRHELEENGRLVQFIFNDSREVVAEQDENKWMLYIRASSLLASSTDHARTYYHYAGDEMGSTTHIVDSEGAVQNRYAYDAWGNVTEQTENVPNRFKFNGQQLDPITQQYYLRARFYNPVIARFTQEDTYRGDGLNLYAYCANNPVVYEDPTGQVRDCIKDAYNRYREQGLSPQDALNAANKDLFYQRNLKDGLSSADALNRTGIDLEVHQAMQKYQLLLNQIDPVTGGQNAQVHGTLVHNEVSTAMRQWAGQQPFQNISINMEVSYLGGMPSSGVLGSSRIDLLIRESGSNPMVNTGNAYIGDIKTGSSNRGSTYGNSQMAQNQGNLLGGPTTSRVPIPGVTHWQFNPGQSSPTQRFF